MELTGTGTVSAPYVITLPTGGTEGQVLKIINGVPSWADLTGNSPVSSCIEDWAQAPAEHVTYRDGTPIPEVQNNSSWASLTTGAWCYFNNDSSKRKLYNWYAIKGIHDAASLTDPTQRKEFAPAGWHVPTDAEWTTLQNCLIDSGFNYDDTTSGNKISKSMAATTGWNSTSISGSPGNNQSSNNSSGFNGIPIGFRASSGVFPNEGDVVIWWISGDDNFVRAKIIRNNQVFLDDNALQKIDGFAVRLIKD